MRAQRPVSALRNRQRKRECVECVSPSDWIQVHKHQGWWLKSALSKPCSRINNYPTVDNIIQALFSCLVKTDDAVREQTCYQTTFVTRSPDYQGTPLEKTPYSQKHRSCVRENKGLLVQPFTDLIQVFLILTLICEKNISTTAELPTQQGLRSCNEDLPAHQNKAEPTGSIPDPPY